MKKKEFDFKAHVGGKNELYVSFREKKSLI